VAAKPEYCGFHRFTANWCAADTDNTLGRGSWGKVLAVRWQIGELDRNFITMQTSSGEELNIIGERCIAELLGGWGSSRSWLGVCPKDLICCSTASRITGSLFWSRSTAPSYVR